VGVRPPAIADPELHAPHHHGVVEHRAVALGDRGEPRDQIGELLCAEALDALEVGPGPNLRGVVVAAIDPDLVLAAALDPAVATDAQRDDAGDPAAERIRDVGVVALEGRQQARAEGGAPERSHATGT
jgi:hypothetical protein